MPNETAASEKMCRKFLDIFQKHSKQAELEIIQECNRAEVTNELPPHYDLSITGMARVELNVKKSDGGHHKPVEHGQTLYIKRSKTLKVPHPHK